MRLRICVSALVVLVLACAACDARPALVSWGSVKDFKSFTLSRVRWDKNADGFVFDAKAKAKDGEDTTVGVLESPQIVTKVPFDQAVPSWNAYTPDGAYVIIMLKARVDGRWTRWYKMELYDVTDKPEPKKSFWDADNVAEVSMDTLAIKQGKKADAVQMRVELLSTDMKTYPTIRFMSVNTNDPTPSGWKQDMPPVKSAWGVELDVPPLSQLTVPNGDIYCSPTSTAMVLGYWSKKLNRPEMNVGIQKTVDNVIDHASPGLGHWCFNTAYPGEFKGMRAYVDRFSGIAQIEWWIAKGVPVIVSHDYGILNHWKNPAGHLMVVIGFTKDGDPIFNDPWTNLSKGEKVRKVFKRADFEDCWLGTKGSQGTVYIVHPEGYKL